MANRGFFQKRGSTTDSISRAGQLTNGLPSGTQESSVYNTFRQEGHDVASAIVGVFGLVGLTMPRDAIADKSSIQINQPFGFIGTTFPRSFDISGGGGGGVTTYYKMRGYYTIGAVYETYVVSGAPSSNPPSGHVLIDVSIISTWQV